MVWIEKISIFMKRARMKEEVFFFVITNISSAMTILTKRYGGIQNGSVKFKIEIQTQYSKVRLETICELAIKTTYKL